MIPCKRPRVTIDPRGDSHDVNCRVPGCDFTYPRDKRYVALVSDAQSTAAWHRQEHRAAVPKITVEPLPEGGHQVTCTCGRREQRGTKTDAIAWRDYHLSADHGLVTC